MVSTVTPLKPAAATVHYFEVDGYYAKNDPEHRKASRWHGEAAALLGLHGPVNPKRFEAVLAGYVPGTELRLGRLRDGEHQHRPGVDVTLSAPKSVSLEALVYAPPKTGARVLRAHDEAVRATLDFIEAELLQTRSYDRQTGRRPRVRADGMVAATFRHLASRNLDPQLHTHAVIANMTRGPDGDWRSAEFTAVQRSKLLIGAYYRNELRTRLEKIGYATVPTLVGRMPGFEIAGYQRPMLDAFSTRRRELLDYMQERGWENNPARAQQAALYTRRRKAEPERQILLGTWQERARELGPARDRDIARGRNGVSASAFSRSEARAPPSALSVVRRAVEHLEERRTVFSANDLRAWALAHGGGRYSLEALDAGIAQLRRDGHLIEATARRADLAFVTDRARNAERDILAGMRAGLGGGRKLAPEAAVEARLEEAGLNPGQRDAASAILLSPHRTVGVQGHAGSGKTTMLRAVAALAEERQIIGLAPSASAVHVLAGEGDIPARTLQGFLARYRDVGDGIAPPVKMEEARKALGGAVLILDEASMVGTVQMRALTRIAEQTDVARLALIGDRRQLRSVEAGQPFGLLQDAGMPTAIMDEVVRQRDADLKAAVLHMADKPRLAVEELGNGVLEMESDELGRTAAQLWLDLHPSLRSGTAILAPTHEHRAEINEAVRHGLEDEGVLHGPELEIERYVNLQLTRSQKGDVANYRPGDVAVFHHDVYGVKARAGDACRVLEAQDDGRVLLAHPDGRERRIDPAGYIRYRLDLYETQPIVLRAGDEVRWTRNDAARGLINGEHAEILAIGRANVHMRTQDGREIAMPRDDPQLHHLDHAYSSTVHAAQGLTCDRVIAVLDTDRAPADQAMFYVELTRARDNVVLLTDDREALIEALEASPAEELSALRAIGEQFEAPEDITQQHPPPQRAAVLDDATRERRRATERFVDQTLSAGAALIRERDEHARQAHSRDAHVTLARGYDEWRKGAVQTLADCNKILEDRETFEIHLDRRPGAEDEFRGLSAQVESDLEEDDTEIQRRRQQQERLQRQEQQRQEQQEQEKREQERREQERREQERREQEKREQEKREQEKRKQETQEQSHRKGMTRGRGGISM